MSKPNISAPTSIKNNRGKGQEDAISLRTIGSIDPKNFFSELFSNIKNDYDTKFKEAMDNFSKEESRIFSKENDKKHKYAATILCGSTAAMYHLDPEQSLITTANLGDSRVYFTIRDTTNSKCKTILLTQDHDLSLPRIKNHLQQYEKEGTYVVQYKNILRVAKFISFISDEGDKFLKAVSSAINIGGVLGDNLIEGLVRTPDIAQYQIAQLITEAGFSIDDIANYQFIITNASDGLTNHVRDQNSEFIVGFEDNNDGQNNQGYVITPNQKFCPSNSISRLIQQYFSQNPNQTLQDFLAQNSQHILRSEEFIREVYADNSKEFDVLLSDNRDDKSLFLDSILESLNTKLPIFTEIQESEIINLCPKTIKLIKDKITNVIDSSHINDDEKLLAILKEFTDFLTLVFNQVYTEDKNKHSQDDLSVSTFTFSMSELQSFNSSVIGAVFDGHGSNKLSTLAVEIFEQKVNEVEKGEFSTILSSSSSSASSAAILQTPTMPSTSLKKRSLKERIESNSLESSQTSQKSKMPNDGSRLTTK